jgi:hypothetical protein
MKLIRTPTILPVHAAPRQGNLDQNKYEPQASRLLIAPPNDPCPSHMSSFCLSGIPAWKLAIYGSSHRVTTSGAEQALCLAGDCFVAQSAPPNNSVKFLPL